jgi:hypothetical protein
MVFVLSIATQAKIIPYKTILNFYNLTSRIKTIEFDCIDEKNNRVQINYNINSNVPIVCVSSTESNLYFNIAYGTIVSDVNNNQWKIVENFELFNIIVKPVYFDFNTVIFGTDPNTVLSDISSGTNTSKSKILFPKQMVLFTFNNKYQKNVPIQLLPNTKLVSLDCNINITASDDVHYLVRYIEPVILI